MNEYNSDFKYIKYLDCHPPRSLAISFKDCDLIIREGMDTLESVSLCDFKLEGLINDENLPNSRSAIKKIILKPNEEYTLVSPEIGQQQGEVQMIIVKVTYLFEHEESDRYITWKYKNETYPLGELMILTGRTKLNETWKGWDLSYYSSTSNISFNPPFNPPVSQPDLNEGGIIFKNITQHNVDIEIFIFN